MAINFRYYPSTNRVPGTYVEVDPSKANNAQLNQRALLIGQITSAGTATPGVPIISQGRDADRAACGAGSMLASMAVRYRTQDAFGELWLLPLSDDGAATAGAGSILFTAGATANGTYALYVAGTAVPVALTAGMTAAQVATAVQAAIAANPNLHCTATAATATVTLTARNKGVAASDIDLRVGYYGEVSPAGLAWTITPFSAGTQNPVSGLTAALANLGDKPFDFIAFPYTDAASLAQIKAFLGDAAGRWNWSQMIYGGWFGAFRGTFGAQTTFGVTNNDPHGSIMGICDVPDPVWRVAADVCANCAVSLRANPAQPLQDVALGIMAPPVQSRFTIGERNSLLYDGISTFKSDDSGQVFIDRMVTTYQTNAQGVPDDSFLDVETDYQLMELNRDFQTQMATQFSRKILVSDTTRIPVGATAMVNTPIIKAAFIARYKYWESQGRVQNSTQFAQQIVVENAGRGLVKVLAPVQLAQQLRQLAILVQFTKP